MNNTTDYDFDTEETIIENNFKEFMENIKINDETINVDIENNEYIDPNKSDIKIPEITQYIANTLDINNKELNESVLTSIQKKKLKINNSNKHNYVNHINNILNNNSILNKLEKQNNSFLYLIKDKKTIFKNKKNFYFNKLNCFFKLWFFKKPIVLNKIWYKKLL